MRKELPRLTLPPEEASRLCTEVCRARCCHGAFLVPLEGGETGETARIEALAVSRGLTLKINRTGGDIFWRHDEQEGGHCPFLLDKAHCSIYAERPKACRDYPSAYSPGCRLSGWQPEHTIFVATVHGKNVPFEFVTMRDTVLQALARFEMLGGSMLVTGVRVDDNRNKAIEGFLKSPAEWLLFLDDDMVFPWNVGIHLASHCEDLVCGLYFQRQWPEAVYPHWYIYSHYGPDSYGQPGDLYRTMDEVVYNATRHLPNTAQAITDRKAKLVPIDAGGAGCLLIRRRVLETMKPPWFRSEGATNGDLRFFKKAKDLGFQAYGDPGVVCSHHTWASIGLDAFRHCLNQKIKAVQQQTDETGENLNTPDYWDYTHGRELLEGWRRDYPESDSIHCHLLAHTERPRVAVADFGCGRAHTYERLRASMNNGRTLEYVGIDYSIVAQEDNAQVYPEATWLIGDIRETKLPAEHFDLCLANHVIEHLEKPDELLAEMWRVLRPMGYLAVGFPLGPVDLPGTPPGEHVQHFDWDRMLVLLARYGSLVWTFHEDPQRPVAVVQKPARVETTEVAS